MNGDDIFMFDYLKNDWNVFQYAAKGMFGCETIGLIAR